MVFYYVHPAVLYVNKFRVAGLLEDGIDQYIEQVRGGQTEERSTALGTAQGSGKRRAVLECAGGERNTPVCSARQRSAAQQLTNAQLRPGQLSRCTSDCLCLVCCRSCLRLVWTRCRGTT